MWMLAVRNSVITTTLAIVIVGPILSLVLHDYSIDFKLIRLGIFAASVFFGRLLYLSLRQKQFHMNIKVDFSKIKINTTMSWWGVIILGLSCPLFLSKYWLSIVILAMIYILLGLGLNIVVGLAGLLNLGFAAFYALGAYGYALGAEYWHMGFWTALPFCALLCGCMGALLAFPVLRMHGDYLAIVTLGFGEIIRLILINLDSFTGGTSGISAPAPTFFGIEFTHQATQGGMTFHQLFSLPYDLRYRYIFTYLILFCVVLLSYRFVTRLQNMPLGRAWEALREDEIACRSLGINHVTTKLSAFSLGAIIGGLGGVFFAAFENFINPASFSFTESALILAIVVLGGMGSAIVLSLDQILKNQDLITNII